MDKINQRLHMHTHNLQLNKKLGCTRTEHIQHHTDNTCLSEVFVPLKIHSAVLKVMMLHSLIAVQGTKSLRGTYILTSTLTMYPITVLHGITKNSTV